jgi:DNA-binding MarR family transcriptional regulator
LRQLLQQQLVYDAFYCHCNYFYGNIIKMKCDELRKSAFSNFFVAYGRIVKEIDRRMSDAGVASLEVYDVLLVLEDAPDRRLRMSELADRIVYSRSGLTRLADRLESNGLIQRLACPNDRRALHVTITDVGLGERRRAWPVLEAAIVDLFGKHLNEEEAAVIARSFARMNEALNG